MQVRAMFVVMTIESILDELVDSLPYEEMDQSDTGPNNSMVERIARDMTIEDVIDELIGRSVKDSEEAKDVDGVRDNQDEDADNEVNENNERDDEQDNGDEDISDDNNNNNNNNNNINNNINFINNINNVSNLCFAEERKRCGRTISIVRLCICVLYCVTVNTRNNYTRAHCE